MKSGGTAVRRSGGLAELTEVIARGRSPRSNPVANAPAGRGIASALKRLAMTPIVVLYALGRPPFRLSGRPPEHDA